MSMFYLSIKNIIEKNKDNSLILSNHYIESSIEKINKLKDPQYHSFLLLSDIKEHLKSYDYEFKKYYKHTINMKGEENINNHEENFTASENENVLQNITNRLFDLKILNLRALVLDLIETDYYSDFQDFCKPENWIFEVIAEIEKTFKNLKKHMELFNEKFLRECERIFLSRNAKFGYCGNLLMINLIVYEKWAKKHFEYDFYPFKKNFKNNFMEERLFDDDKLLKIIDEEND
ncbi:hypothetical protein GVAV_000121 [Gurleya vavrai]